MPVAWLQTLEAAVAKHPVAQAGVDMAEGAAAAETTATRAEKAMTDFILNLVKRGFES